MKNLIILFISICLLLTSCASKSNLDEPFITKDPEELEKYASKALQQAQFKLDSLRKTELLQEQQSD
jgi:hypothetical protein